MPRTTLLNTGTEDLKELLGNGKTYTVPAYQRDYSWKQEHWEDLWEDLTQAESSDEDHYMGAIVLESGERKQYRIIDGQQRLATLSILILACVELLYQFAAGGNDAEANAERAALLETSYLGFKDPTTLRIIPKLKLNANDDDFFQLNVAQRKPPFGGERGLTDSERLLWNCFKFFSERVREKFAKGKGEAVTAFVSDVVTERLVFITVRVQNQVSAYTVFETLNARGIELTETDLLKNYLLSLADKLSKTQMDPLLRQWSRITSRVGTATFPEFLRHHYNSQHGFIRQKQLFKVLKSQITELEQVFALLDRLENDAAWYEALRDYDSEFWLDYQGARQHVRVLNLFRVSQYIPLILAAKDIFTRKDDIVQILRYCAVLSLRFNGISRRSTHQLEEVYNSAALAIRAMTAPSLKEVRTSLREIYVSDEEFTADFAVLKLKNRGTAGKRLKYILAQIERQLSGSEINDETMAATVEHILPENPQTDAWVQFTEEEHERLYQRLGNYSLLERGLNANDSANASFEQKLQAYEKSKYALSRQLTDYGDWSPQTIDQRQRSLAAVATAIWRLDL